MNIFRTNPFDSIVPIRGEGCRIWDRDGREYIDLLAGVWCLVLGYRHPRFTQAIKDQLDKLVHVGYSFLTDELQQAMKKLRSILPPELNRVTFLSSGSEAVEFAIKVAWLSRGQPTVIGFEGGYYGATVRAFALSEAGRHVAFVPPDETPQILSPHCAQCPIDQHCPDCDFACLRVSAEQIEARLNTDEMAAIIFEPVQAVGGVIVPPPGYLERLASLARKWGVLLISEEVTTGMGRTGDWFGFQCDGIVPDILVLGKALGNGLPVAAIVTTAGVEESCAGKLRHVQSHQNDPLSGRAASTVIEILQQEALVQRSKEMGEYLLAGLKGLQKNYPLIREVRGRGLIGAFELQEGSGEAGERLYSFLLEKGIILNYQPHSQTFRFFPPFVIGKEEIDTTLAALEDGLRQL